MIVSDISGDDIEFPLLPNLHTLELNKNKIENLEAFLDKVKTNLPNLSFLSLLMNIACPNELLPGFDEEDYQRYRYLVLYALPGLKFLDSRAVTQTVCVP